jgi:transposase
MKKISILGVDLAKASFTICGLDEKGNKVIGKDMKPERFREYLGALEKTTVIFEACGSAHYWARTAIGLGHTAKLIAPQKVTAFRKNNKNDTNDALAICIAAQCSGMEFAAIKQTEHQDLQAALRNRERLIGKQTATVNYIRGILAEYGVKVPVGINQIRSVLSEISNRSKKEADNIFAKKLTPVILEIVDDVHKEVLATLDGIESMDKLISRLTSNNDNCKRLMSIPGVGPITAASVVSTLINPKDYKNGRQYAASLGLTPRHVYGPAHVVNLGLETFIFLPPHQNLWVNSGSGRFPS